MSLQLIYGRGGSGKTTACLELTDRLTAGGAPVVWMVPEQYSLETERLLANRYPEAGMAKVDVLSFERMAKRVFSTVGPALCDYVTDSGKQMLMERCLLACEKKLTVLAKAARHTAFPAQLVDAFSELKRFGVAPEDLRRTAAQCSAPFLQFKLTDMALLYEEYNKQFRLPLMDSEDDMDRLQDRIQAHGLFAGSHIVVDNFDTFSPNQLGVLNQLLLHAQSVTVSLQCDGLDPGLPADTFGRAKATAQKLISLAKAGNIKLLPPIALPNCLKYQNQPELAHLEGQYFTYPAKAYPEPTGYIRLFAATNAAAEAERVALEIRRLCRESGCRYRDIAVLIRDEQYQPVLEAAFASCNIPASGGRTLSPNQHEFVQGLLSVLNCFVHNYSYDAMFGWVKSGLSGISQQDADLLENYVLAVGNTPQLWQREEDWTFPAGYPDWQLERINRLKNTVRGPVIGLAQRLKGRKTVTQIITEFQAFLQEIEAEEQLLRYVSQLEQRGLVQQAKASVKAYNALIDTLNQMALLLGDQAISFEKFTSILNAGLGGIEIGQPPATADQVELAIVDRFRGQGAKCVFLMGVTDGVLPRGYVAEGLLSEADRRAIQQATGVELDTAMSRHSGENQLIYTALTSARERLFVSYPLADQDGKALPPSPIVGRLKALFPKLEEGSNLFDSQDAMDEIEGVVPTFHRLIASNQSGLWSQVADWYGEHRPQLADVAAKAKRYTNCPTQLRQDTVRLLYGDVLSASVSKAEQFSRCQFAYFVRYGLRAEPRPEHTIEAADAGTFMHEIIERFSRFGADLGWDNIDEPLCRQKAEEITELVLSGALSQRYTESPRYRHLLGKMTRTMGTTLWHITEYYQQSAFVPIGYELAFDGTDFPAIEVPLKNGGVARLTGKVDRADIYRTDSGNYISIVDYKSGHKDIDYSQILCGMQIQLPTYIDAVCKAISQREGVQAVPASMLYYTIQDPVISAQRDATDQQLHQEVKKQLRMRGLSLMDESVTEGLGTVFTVKSQATAEQIKRLCTTAHRQLTKAVEGIVRGEIGINPARFGGKTSCDWCPYYSVCGFDPTMKGNRYRSISKLSREEFFDHVDGTAEAGN